MFDNLTTLSNNDIASEGVDILIAGTDTTAFTMTLAIILLTGKPELQKKLVDTLNEALKGTPRGQNLSLQNLEKIDFLVCRSPYGLDTSTR